MNKKQFFATLFALLVVTSGITAVATVTSESVNAAPPGFVDVPADKVRTSDTVITPGKAVGKPLAEGGQSGTSGKGGPPRFVHDNIPSHALENIQTNKHPDSTIVEFATTQNGGLSMVVTDDEHHEGRTLSIPVEVFDRTIDRRPGIARGVHEDGTKWRETVTYRNEYALIEVPRFSTNSITWNGEVNVNATPGSDEATFTYDVESDEEVGSVNLTWTGVLNSEWDNETQTGIGASTSTHDTDSELSAGDTSPSTVSVTGSGASAKVNIAPPGSGTETFDYTGSEQTWTVPGGVTSVTVKLWGAGGGDGDFSDGYGFGENGGYVEGTLSTTPGETLYAYVGGAGDDGVQADGGWNGGGDGDTYAGGGGGGTDIRQGGNTNSDRVAVAGGGGGGGTSGQGYTADGGQGGADQAEDGEDAGSASGGAGGTQACGGSSPNGGNGRATSNGESSGGGGAGYCGGAAGGTADSVDGAGGGGGSNYDDDLASVAANERGTGNAGHGQIQISYTSTASASFISANHSVEQASSATVNISSLTDATATITVESWTGSSWTEETQTTGVSSTGDTSLSWTATNDKVRVNVSAVPTEPVGDPSMDVESIDVTGNADQSVSPAGNLNVTGPSGNNDPEVTVTGHADDVGNTPKNIQLTIDGTTYDFGDLGDGASTTLETPKLSNTSSTLEWSFTDGSIDYTASFKERTLTDDPQLEVNGNTSTHTGTLADGASSTYTLDSSWIQTGTNRLNLTVGGSLPADAPTPQVELRYSHNAQADQSVSFSAEEWSETYNVSRTWDNERHDANLSVPFDSGKVVAIRDVEVRTNKTGGWSSVASKNQDFDGTTLTVDFGTVAVNETKEIRANGTKVQPNNASITVLEPTTANNDLNSKIQIDTWNSDSYIGVGDTRQGDRVHYITGASWGSSDEHVLIRSGGAQELNIPGASAGSDFRVKTFPLKASIDSGTVKISIDEVDTTEPKFTVAPGSRTGDTVSYTFVDAKDGQKYNLYSVTHEAARDQGTASSPLTLTDDDSAETLQFQEDSGGGGGSGGGSGGSGGGGLVDTGKSVVEAASAKVPQPGGIAGNAILLLLALLLVGGLVYYSRESAGKGTDGMRPSPDSTLGRVTRGLSERLPVLGRPLKRVLTGLRNALVRLTPVVRRFLRMIRNDPLGMIVTVLFLIGVMYRFGLLPAVPSEFVLVVPLVFSPLAAFLLLKEIGQYSFRVWAVVSTFAFVAMAETLQPGGIIGPLGENLGRFTGLAIIAAAGLIYQFLRTRGEPETVLRIQASDGEGDD